jgi:hypothetical protein
VVCASGRPAPAAPCSPSCRSRAPTAPVPGGDVAVLEVEVDVLRWSWLGDGGKVIPVTPSLALLLVLQRHNVGLDSMRGHPWASLLLRMTSRVPTC